MVSIPGTFQLMILTTHTDKIIGSYQLRDPHILKLLRAPSSPSLPSKAVRPQPLSTQILLLLDAKSRRAGRREECRAGGGEALLEARNMRRVGDRIGDIQSVPKRREDVRF
jgi:hypothetical protein